MCLTVDINLTKKMLKSDKKVFTFYKMFGLIDDNVLISPCQNFKFDKSLKYYAGQKLNGYFLDNLQDSQKIYGQCFHANVKKNESAIQIKVKKEDIIAFGDNGDVCFYKFEILKKDYDKFINSVTLRQLIKLNFSDYLSRKIIRNYIRQHGKEMLDKSFHYKLKFVRYKDDIIDGFRWEISKEGYVYWLKKSYEYGNKEIITKAKQ